MNEVIPRPSHPINKNIMLGIKTSIIIDTINSIIIYVNRVLFGSAFI